MAELATSPLRPRPRLDVKRLKGHSATYRLRIGAWRVLYTVDEPARVVRVTSVAPRSHAYK